MDRTMVKNREGLLEPLVITKIQEKTSAAVEGLEGVSQSELEVDSKLQFFNGITTEQIQETLIKTAVDKIDIDRPNWTFVAARLFLSDLYHKVGKTLDNEKGQRYPKIEKYISVAESEGRFIIGLKEKYNLSRLDSAINEKRDLQFNYLGIKTLYDRYILKNKEGSPIELPQLLFMGVSMFLAQNEESLDSIDFIHKTYGDRAKNAGILTKQEILDLNLSEEELKKEIRTAWAITFYELISSFEVMLATPTLSNARTPRHQLSSCYVGSTPDNIEGIFDAYKEQSLLSKYGGGIGWDWTQVRSIGGYIDNHKGAAGGVIPFLKIENDIAIAVDQLGCVSQNSFVKVLKKVKTNNFEHDFRREYEKYDFSEKELIEGIASYAESFSFEYGKFSKNFIASLLFDYIVNNKGSDFLEKVYGLSHDQYKKIIGKYKKINKGLPEGFETVKDYPEYAISKEGIVINVKTLRPLSKVINRKGYVSVSLGKKAIPLHKLLVKQFISTDLNNLTINHIDRNKLNNSLDNFEIISNEKNVSLGWTEESKKKRTEMSRIRKHLSNGINLKGKRRDSHEFEILDIEIDIVPIKEVRLGDLILSFDISNKENQFKPIISKHEIRVKKKDQIKIVYDNGNYIVTSVWHPTPKIIEDKVIYVRADSLEIGDESINDKMEKVKIVEISNPSISEEFYDLSVRDNNNYFCSTDNSDSEFHLIHNTRKGAIAVYLEPWHGDILDFLDLKKNSGEERRRAHDLFPALWLNDLFMERVSNNDKWTLFNVAETPDLPNLYGEEFKKRYEEYENDDSIEFKEVVSAKELWKRVLIQYFETGSPFLCFKDSANRANPNKHKGVIRSSNLCTEIFQNTQSNQYKVQIDFEDSTQMTIDEEELITTDAGVTKPGKKVTSIDSINGKKVYFVEKVPELGETAVCNLASVNLSKVNTREKIEQVVPIAVRILDNVIDLNYYPTRKAKLTNERSRAIGLGVMGESEFLALNKIHFGSETHLNKIDEIMEMISYNAISASSDIAVDKGIYQNFEGSEWSKGIFPFDLAKESVNDLTTRNSLVYDWDKLRVKVKEQGMRNGYLMAVAPTSSISILVGTTQAIEPVYRRKWFEENLSGLIPVVVPHLNPDTWEYYEPAFELDQLKLIRAGAVRQKWIDQGQALNIFIRNDKASAKYLNEIYMLAWKLGLKSNYYLRAESPEVNENAVADRSIECSGCQ